MNALEEYRTQIREKDRRLLLLIQERFSISERIAKVKKEKNLSIVDSDAEQVTIGNLVKTASTLDMSVPFARRIGELLIEESVRRQEANRPPKQSKDQVMKEIFELTQATLAKGQKMIRFEVGEPNFPTSSRIIHGLTQTFRHKKIIGYGSASGLPELRRALADELNREHRTKIDPDQILITPGGRFGIFAAITTHLSPLERVIVPQPAWPAYEECVNFAQGRIIPINTKLESRWEIDLETLERELKKGARILILNSPNNPTGKVISKRKFDEIVGLARKYNTLVLSDEVYGKYVRSERTSILEGEYENSVYIDSFSKQFGLTGWRVAFLVTTKERVMRIRRVLQTAITCVPEFIQRAALVAIEKDRPQARRNIEAIMKKVDLTCAELSKLGTVSFYKPDGAFYVFPKANKPNFDSLKFAKELLEQHGVSIGPGQSFGDYPEFFRLAVSLPAKEIPSAIKSIGRAIDSWP